LGGIAAARAVALGDCDGDGALDLLLARDGFSVLYRATGPLAFTEITAASGANVLGKTTGGVFADVDGDGDLDLYVLRYADYGDLRAGRDSEVSDVLLLNGGRCAFLDHDGDGDPDLYVATDYGLLAEPNRLYENRGGWFVDIAAGLGVDARIYGMSAGVADHDADGDEDIYVSQFFHNVFYVRTEGSYVERARRFGISSAWYRDAGQSAARMPSFDPASQDPEQRAYAEYVAAYAADRPDDEQVFMLSSWASEWGDLDQDGRLDLFVANGFIGADWIYPEGHRQPDRLFVQQPGGTFAEVSEQAGLADAGSGRGAALADLDGDGDLDLLVFNARMPPTNMPRHGVYRNDTAGGQAVWVRVRGLPQSPHAVGARVAIRIAERWQYRTVRLSSSAFGAVADPRGLHFGVGDAAQVDEVVVRWPWGGGETRIVGPLPIGGVIEVSRGEGEGR
jgi:hypothetical protein